MRELVFNALMDDRETQTLRVSGTLKNVPDGQKFKEPDVMTSQDFAQAQKALDFAVGHLNVSMPRRITPEVLLAALKSKSIADEVKCHLEAFLDETDVGLLSDMKRGGLVTYRELADKAHALLPVGHDVRTWLDERL